jgi:nicotinamidase-related amidase
MTRIYGLELPTSKQEWITPARCALLVYDMQVGICHQVESEAVIASIVRLVSAARAAGMRVIFMRHLSLPKALMGRMAYRTAMAWQQTDDPEAIQPWFLRDSPGFAIVPELSPSADEVIFDKITMSAFEGTPLAITLQDCGIAAIAIAGIALEIGIEPTVRHATDLGFVPIVIEDACGHGDAEAAARSLAQMRFSGDAIFCYETEFTGFLASQNWTPRQA